MNPKTLKPGHVITWRRTFYDMGKVTPDRRRLVEQWEDVQVKFMAFLEGRWIVFRRPGCGPIIEHIREFPFLEQPPKRSKKHEDPTATPDPS